MAMYCLKIAEEEMAKETVVMSLQVLSMSSRLTVATILQTPQLFPAVDQSTHLLILEWQPVV